jgi:hypothetical protein
VIVRESVPVGALADADIVNVEVPFPRTIVGLNDAPVFVGSPSTLNVTVEEYSPRAETVTVYATLEFLVTV